jgi:hypothetical protein
MTVTDIVERLRQRIDALDTTASVLVRHRAADEIERLRGELHSVHAHLNHMRTMSDVLRGEIERLRAALTGL